MSEALPPGICSFYFFPSLSFLLPCLREDVPTSSHMPTPHQVSLLPWTSNLSRVRYAFSH